MRPIWHFHLVLQISSTLQQGLQLMLITFINDFYCVAMDEIVNAVQINSTSKVNCLSVYTYWSPYLTEKQCRPLAYNVRVSMNYIVITFYFLKKNEF